MVPVVRRSGPVAVGLLSLLFGACGAGAQVTAAQQEPIDLIELVSFFLVPEGAQPLGEWYLFSGPASPIAWNPNEVRWDERRQTFVRDGSAVVAVDGSPMHTAGSTELLRWPIRLFGPREGFTRVAIASRIASPELSLDLPAQLAARGIEYEAKRCDTAEPAAGNRLFAIRWQGYEPAWVHHQWACEGGSCAAYLSVSLTEPEASALQNMPNTDCGVASAPIDPRGGPALMFAGGAEDLTEDEQLQIFSELGLAVAPDGAGFVDTVCRQPAGADVQFPDLNGDGVAEVLVVFGNTCTSGAAGASVQLFIKQDGAYVGQLGFPGISADPLETRNMGYPDLVIGGPGFCFPVWRWNGTMYDYDRNEPQAEGGCPG